MSFANVGRTWTPRTFREYLGTLSPPSWARSVTIHHTAAPSLAQRPLGLTAQHMANIRDYYARTLGWSRGPHLFADDDEILGMTPLTLKGTHAVSFNGSSIGIEALGNYDVEDPLRGRGLAVWQTTAQAALALLDWLGLEPSIKTVLFHRDDPRTSKTCPGRKVTKEWFIDLMGHYSSQPAPLVAPVNLSMTDDLVPVVKRAVEQSGLSYAFIVSKLKRVGQVHTLGGAWLEGARYDAALGATIAPASEIDDACRALKA